MTVSLPSCKHTHLKERLYSGNIMKVVSLRNFKQLSLLECRWPFSSGMWRASHWQSDCPGDNRKVINCSIFSCHQKITPWHRSEENVSGAWECQAGHTTDIINTLESLGFTLVTHMPFLPAIWQDKGPATQPPLDKQLAVLSASKHIPSYHPETLTVMYWPQCGICGLCHSVTVWLSSSLNLYSR